MMLEKTLESPWTARRSNQSMLKLKLQFFGHLMQRVNSLEKTAGKDEGKRRKEQQKIRCLDNIITNSMAMYLGKLRETVGFLGGASGKESACQS